MLYKQDEEQRSEICLMLWFGVTEQPSRFGFLHLLLSSKLKTGARQIITVMGVLFSLLLSANVVQRLPRKRNQTALYSLNKSL